MLIKPFLIVLTVMLTCCKNVSSVLNFNNSEQLQFYHNTSRKAPKLYIEVIIAKISLVFSMSFTFLSRKNFVPNHVPLV
jgi:hypothetical protein